MRAFSRQASTGQIPLPPLAIYHAATTALQPQSNIEVYSEMYRFISRHPLPNRLGRCVLRRVCV